MPLQPAALTPQIVQAIRSNIKEINDQAIDMPFQDMLAHACAYGFVVSLKNEAKAGGGAGGITIGGGIGHGISNLDDQRMMQTARDYLVERVGYKGIAIEAILLGIYTPTVAHLLGFTDVIPTNGFGGQAEHVVNLVRENVKSHIIENFPDDVQQRMRDHARIQFLLIEAIAEGFVHELLTYGIPGVIPSGAGAGSVVASFS